MLSEFDAWAGTRHLRAHVAGMQLAQLRTYVELLKAWNSKINLTGFSMTSDMDQAMDRLILEPVAAAALLPASIRSVVDVGSGGGSPALPLAIVAPQLSLTLVESSARKGVFLREAIRAIGLPTAKVLTERVEAVADAANHEVFDAATIRAVRLDADLIAHVSALVRPHGFLIYFDRASHEPRPGWPAFPLASRKPIGTSDSSLTIYQRTP